MKDTIYREDAIEAVRKELVCDGRHEAHDKTCRFIADVLLSALPSAEATGDLISRQWLLDLYDTPKDGDGVEWKVPLEVVRQNILDAPSADAVSFEDAMQIRNTILVKEYLRGRRDAEVVQGEWINREYCQVDEDAYEVATCSNCKSEITIEYPYDNYCPNCGARMKGGENK